MAARLGLQDRGVGPGGLRLGPIYVLETDRDQVSIENSCWAGCMSLTLLLSLPDLTSAESPGFMPGGVTSGALRDLCQAEGRNVD